jgi:hypothetical protein
LERVIELDETVPGFDHSGQAMVRPAALPEKQPGALEWLRRAVDSGREEDRVFEEPSLEALSGDPQYEALVARIRAKVAQNGGGPRRKSGVQANNRHDAGKMR